MPNPLGSIRLFVDDVPAKTNAFGRARVYRNDGTEATIRVVFAFQRTQPDLEFDGVKYPLGDRIPLWLVVLTCLPLTLLFVGGGIGGGIGAIGFFMNRSLVSARFGVMTKAIAIVGVTGATVVSWVVAAAAIRTVVG